MIKGDFIYMINYDQLVDKMKENGITSFTIKKGQSKEGFMSQCTYTRMKLNQGYIGLEIIEKILNELNIDKIQLVKNSENNFEIIIPDETSEKGAE